MASSKTGTRKRKREYYYSAGYDLEFVDTPDQRYICSICNDVLRQAHLTGCCGNICESHLLPNSHKKEKKEVCPRCRKGRGVTNRPIIREIKQLKVYCRNKEEGCVWEGELEEVENHLTSEDGCNYERVPCGNEGCSETMRREDLCIHLQEKCYYRPYECEHCGYVDTYTNITGETQLRRKSLKDSHYSECLEYPLDCPNRCGETDIERKAMSAHQSICPLEPLDCPFKDVGCTEKIARKDLEDHMTANELKHILQRFEGLQQSLQHAKQNQEIIMRAMNILMESSNGTTMLLSSLLQFNKELKRELDEETERGQRELHLLKGDVRREIESLKKSLQANGSAPSIIPRSLTNVELLLQMRLDKVGDTLTFRVTEFPQLMQRKEPWHSPPFTVAGKVRVHLALIPINNAKDEKIRMSAHLALVDVLRKEECWWLAYNVSVAAIGEYKSATPQTVEMCTYREVSHPSSWSVQCAAQFSFPTCGKMLQSKPVYLDIEEVNSQSENNFMVVQLRLMEHEHYVKQIG